MHNLMRAAHTLKGSSASVGLNNLSQIAHGLEGIFKSLYNPDLIVDKELDTLLFQAYEYLRLSVTETTASRGENDPDVLNRAASILAEVQIKLGDDFNPDAAIPSSVELGFDVVGSIFEVGVKQRLSELEAMLSGGDAIAVTQTLQNCTEIFIGLAESLNLPGFGAIASLAEQALHVAPERALKVAEIALADFQAAHRAVIEGDRASGGQPSPALQAIAAGEDPPDPVVGPAVGEAEIEEAAEPLPPEPREEAPVERDRPILFPLPEELEAVESANAEAEPPAESEAEVPDEPDFGSEEPDLESWAVSAESAGSPTNGSIAYDDEPFELQDSEASAQPTLDQVFGNFDPALLSDFSPAEAGREEEDEEDELPPE
ncbi:MAG: Hpt domain-containing protein, partial [Cyanobacteriota bacterium]|nr:Hpt domain-containing protein [Cyanobacteriota bacterium]